MSLDSDMARIRSAALDAADPALCVRQHLRHTQGRLATNGLEWNLAECQQVTVIAAGKAAAPMAQAAAEILGQKLQAGIVVTKYGHAASYPLPDAFRVIEAGHPVPDAAGRVGAQLIADMLRAATARDRIIFLLSGGASALLPLPVEGVSLSDLQKTTDVLLRAGAPIGDLNAVRKHLSQLAGGQLARLAAPAPVLSLILSDVVGDPLDVIGSGPTAPDPTTYSDALVILERYDARDRVPEPVIAHLEAGAAGIFAETPKPADPLFARVRNLIVGSNRQAAQAACRTTEDLGYRTLLLSTFVEGEAREVAKVAAAVARGIRTHGDPLPPPACVVWGGETTVTVRGSGKGGRNQELALAAAAGLQGLDGVMLMALATDGTDGPTDAAGAVIDGKTAKRLRAAGWSIPTVLQQNDAYPALAAVGALLRTGPTGTNVNDVLVVLVL